MQCLINVYSISEWIVLCVEDVLISQHITEHHGYHYTRYLNCKPSQFKKYEIHLLTNFHVCMFNVYFFKIFINLNAAIATNHALAQHIMVMRRRDTIKCRCSVNCVFSSVEGGGFYWSFSQLGGLWLQVQLSTENGTRFLSCKLFEWKTFHAKFQIHWVSKNMYRNELCFFDFVLTFFTLLKMYLFSYLQHLSQINFILKL